MGSSSRTTTRDWKFSVTNKADSGSSPVHSKQTQLVRKKEVQKTSRMKVQTLMILLQRLLENSGSTAHNLGLQRLTYL
jgi:hypothetical protein